MLFGGNMVQKRWDYHQLSVHILTASWL